MKRIELSDLSIRTIFLFSFLSITVLSITLFYLITVNSISNNLDKTEYAELQTNSIVIQEDLDLLNASLFILATDYGVWDESYQNAKEKDKEFFDTNFKDWLPENQDVDLILVLDSSENILTSYGPEAAMIKDSRWIDLAIKNNLYNRYLFVEKQYNSGLTRIDGVLYSVGVSPIVKQDMLLPPDGVVVIGKKIGEEFMEDLSDKYNYEISLCFVDGSSYGELPEETIDQYLKTGSQPTKQTEGYSVISVPLENSLSKKIGDLIIGSSHSKYAQLYSSINRYIGIGSFILLAIIIALSLLLSKFITSPLRNMEKKINRMMERGELEPLDGIKSASEIKTVTNAFNSLIETIHSREEDIETKDRFIALISHEFKTPITIINAAVQAMNLICKDDITPKIAGYLNKINRNSLRQLRLVDNLLDITRIKAGQIKVSERNIDVVTHTKEIVDSVRIYALQKDIDLAFSSTLSKMIILIDEQKYERILLNLISNSIKFTPSGERITVSLSAEEGWLKLEVADTGIGIPAEKQGLIFERFGQVDSSLSRQAEGTGIGLYLVKSFVDVLGGKISLVSEEGGGSSFTIILPLKSDGHQIEEDNPVRDKVEQASSLEFSDIIL
jgi:signal transduction histidine kinase/sensor domain CHASE-containing protein